MYRASSSWILVLLLLVASCRAPEPEPPMVGLGSAGIAVNRVAEAMRTRPLAPLPAAEVTAREAAAALPVMPFEPPAEFPVRFTTNVPLELTATTDPLQHAIGVRFGPSELSAGALDRAFVYVYFYPPDFRVLEAMQLIRQQADRAGERETAEPLMPWSLEERAYEYRTSLGQTMIGTIALGRFDAGYYHVVIEYPEPLADRFLPLARRVLDDWRWLGPSPATARPTTAS
jgi:hypothetical protein